MHLETQRSLNSAVQTTMHLNDQKSKNIKTKPLTFEPWGSNTHEPRNQSTYALETPKSMHFPFHWSNVIYSRIKPQPLTPSAKPNLLDKPHPPKAQTPKQTLAPQQKACHAQARSVGLFLWGGAPKTIRKRCWHHNFGYFWPRNVWHLWHLMGCNPINSDFKNCCLCNKQWSDGVYSKKNDYRFHGFQMHRLLALKVHGSWGLIMVQKNSFKVQIFVVSC